MHVNPPASSYLGVLLKFPKQLQALHLPSNALGSNNCFIQLTRCCCSGVLVLRVQGELCDQRLVVFYTNATSYEEWPSGGLVGNGTGGNGSLPNLVVCCCDRAQHSACTGLTLQPLRQQSPASPYSTPEACHATADGVNTAAFNVKR